MEGLLRRVSYSHAGGSLREGGERRKTRAEDDGALYKSVVWSLFIRSLIR